MNRYYRYSFFFLRDVFFFSEKNGGRERETCPLTFNHLARVKAIIYSLKIEKQLEMQ